MKKNHKVLVVDDVGICRLIPGMILRPFGYEVLEACNGCEALKILKKNDVNLVLLDLSMPGIAGKDVFNELKKNPVLDSPKIVAYTTIHSDSEFHELMSMGFEGVLHKPAKTIILLDLVNKLLGQKNQ